MLRTENYRPPKKNPLQEYLFGEDSLACRILPAVPLDPPPQEQAPAKTSMYIGDGPPIKWPPVQPARVSKHSAAYARPQFKTRKRR